MTQRREPRIARQHVDDIAAYIGGVLNRLDDLTATLVEPAGDPEWVRLRAELDDLVRTYPQIRSIVRESGYEA